MGLDDLFRVEEGAAQAIAGWCAAAACAAALALGFFAAVDALDTLSSSSPGFAAREWWRHVAGDPGEGEREAKALLAFAAAESGLPGIARARVWAADRLGGGTEGSFNPALFKVTLGEGFAEGSSYAQRWLVFHEAGHAAAMLTSRSGPEPLPAWGLSAGAAEALRSSIVYREAFAESFADVFAAAMALRADPRDPRAREELMEALAGRAPSDSVAHDTQPALAIAARRASELAALRGPKLLALVDAVASEGAALSVGEWGAEREALCLRGWWGWRRWALDGAHESFSDPARMAGSQPPAPGEPQAAELAELMALSPERGARRRQAELRMAKSPQGARAPRWASMSVDGPLAEPEPGLGGWGAKAGRALREAASLPFKAAALALEPRRPEGCAPD